MLYILPYACYIETSHVTEKIFVKHNAPGGNEVRKAIISIKVNVTGSFERTSSVEYAFQI